MNFTDLRILKTQEKLQNALLELLKEKELKAISVKEICDKAGISRNAFYQHYGYKEDLYDQMVTRATESIRDSLAPVISDASDLSEEIIVLHAKHIVSGISEVKDLIYVMLKGDKGIILRQLTDFIFEMYLQNALPFFDLQDSTELRLYYEYQSAGMAAFIIKWVMDGDLSQEKAGELLARILLQAPGKKPIIGSNPNDVTEFIPEEKQ